MPIFPVLELEGTLQINDKTRLSGVKSFISKDEAAITLVRIKPETAGSFVTVSGTGLTYKDWYLDWQYSSAGTKTVSIEITTNAAPTTVTADIVVVTSATDLLWSSDKDLTAHEPDILKWVQPGRNSFLNVHRNAQSLILDWLDSIRVWKNDGTRLEKEDMLVSQDLKQLSIYWVLELIFLGLSNKTDDVFSQKALEYSKLKKKTQDRGRIQADFDGDEELDTNESSDMKSFRMVRR